MRVKLYIEDIKTLLETAKKNNKLEYWSEIAMEWIENANAEVYKLRQKLNEKGNKNT